MWGSVHTQAIWAPGHHMGLRAPISLDGPCLRRATLTTPTVLIVHTQDRFDLTVLSMSPTHSKISDQESWLGSALLNSRITCLVKNHFISVARSSLCTRVRSVHHFPYCVFFFYLFTFTCFREREIDLLFHLPMRSLVVSCMCPDWGSNPQPWCVRTTL